MLYERRFFVEKKWVIFLKGNWVFFLYDLFDFEIVSAFFKLKSWEEIGDIERVDWIYHLGGFRIGAMIDDFGFLLLCLWLLRWRLYLSIMVYVDSVGIFIEWDWCILLSILWIEGWLRAEEWFWLIRRISNYTIGCGFRIGFIIKIKIILVGLFDWDELLFLN